MRDIDCDGDGVDDVSVEQSDAADIADCADNLDDIALNSPDCDATVGDFNDCFDDLTTATDDEICDETFLPVSCEFLADPDCAG